MKKHLLTLLVAGAASAFAGLQAQNQTNKSIGNYASHSPEPNGVTIKTDNGSFRAVVYSANVIRLRYSAKGLWDEQSYAVTATPLTTKAELKDEAGSLTLSTDSLKLVINKQPVRVKLFDLKGRLISEDEEAFGTGWIGDNVTTYKHMQPGERFIGLGEKTGALDRKGEAYTNWNTDFFGYPAGADPLYVSLPFYMGLHGGLSYGIFMDNSYRSRFNFGASNNRFSSFSADEGEMNYYLIHGSTVSKVIEQYTWLTGRMPMPPLWSLGLQQCRYSYYPESRVMGIARGYRERNIPADAIVLDIHYMDNYKIFTWDKERFPQPKLMTDNLRKMGFHTVTIHDPGIKVEKGYQTYDDGVAKNIFAKYPDGTNFSAQVWPGWCHFPDFTDSKTRSWWGDQLKTYADAGVDGFWNDMNEPASWGASIPDLVEFNFEGNKGTIRKAHNIYGLLMARSSYEGGRRQLGKRPFILTRAAYSGVQRYSAVWTGDNVSTDEHMMSGVRLLNSMGLSGIPFVGTDVGGFTGNPTKELFARWVSIGAFSPFFRIHTAIDTKEADPWSFGERVEAINKNYIQLRYKLLPYLYSSFYETSRTGIPVSRSLAISYPNDSKVFDWRYLHQFFFGPNIMVAPLESNKDLARVYLPDDNTWYDMYDDRAFAGKQELIVDAPLEKLPLFIRGGSIIPMQTLTMSTSEAPKDTLFVHIYNGKTGSSFVQYEDDGSSFDNEKGGYNRRTISLDPSGHSLTFEKAEGSYKSKFNNLKVVFHGFSNLPSDLKTPQGKAAFKNQNVSIVSGLPNFDPVGSGKAAPAAQAKAAVLPNSPDKIVLTW